MATPSNPERQAHGRIHGTYETGKFVNPKWWNDTYESGWDKVKEAFRRDWEQTKNDLSFGNAGKDLNQDVPDTVKQATGKEAIPPANLPNPDVNMKGKKVVTGYTTYEPAYRFGYGARQHYGKEFTTWNNDVESRLQTEWTGIYKDRPWTESRDYIRRGFEYRI